MNAKYLLTIAVYIAGLLWNNPLGLPIRGMAGTWESTHRHDTLGFEVERILPGGVVRSFSYDDIGRLVESRTRKDSHTRHTRRYRWGVADRLLSVDDSRRGETRYSYTPTGQLDRAEYPGDSERWRKSDQVGNLYPDPEMKMRRYLSGGRLEQDGEWHCEYDADGNLTERYRGTGRWLDGRKECWRYRWNADGSLATVIRPDKKEVWFTYDALGRRLSKSFGTTVTRWVWNGNVPLHQWKQRREYSVMEDRWDTEAERRDMTVWLFDEESFVPAAMIKEGRSYSILTDQLGTPTEAYDTEGNEVWSRVLDMDGNVIGETGNKGMVPFLFPGQYYDHETGLAYNRFRYYSPQMGMYVSQDPIGLAGGILNLYGYVNDTNAWVDSFGLNAKPETAKEWEHRFSKMNPDERYNAALGKLRKVARKNGWTKDPILTKKNKRETFKDDKGRIFACDTQHGRFEYLDSRGKHLGEYNIDGKSIDGKIDRTKGHNIYMK